MNPTTQTILTSDLRKMIGEELESLITIRHDLHAHPELGYQETRTNSVVARELGASGIAFESGLAQGTGLLGHLPGDGDRSIGLRADMDALPILEETGVDYASLNSGVMHACGHDGHTVILLGAAKVLKKISEQQPLPRPVTFVFQPAEEGGAGGKKMVEDGCLDGSVLGTPVASMFGLHGWPLFPLGEVGTKPGPLLAASDEFDISIRGVGVHAAMPHLGRDPIVAASAVIGALQSIPSRNVDPIDSVVISITKLEAGTAYNVIPDEVKIAGTVRTLTHKTHAIARRRLREIAEGIARAYGAVAKVEMHLGYPVTDNDPAAVEIVEREARGALGDSRWISVENPVMGGEDFSFYGQAVPSCFFFLGLRPPGVAAMPNLHQPTFDFNDDAIATGVEMFCRLALRSGE